MYFFEIIRSKIYEHIMKWHSSKFNFISRQWITLLVVPLLFTFKEINEVQKFDHGVREEGRRRSKPNTAPCTQWCRKEMWIGFCLWLPLILHKACPVCVQAIHWKQIGCFNYFILQYTIYLNLITLFSLSIQNTCNRYSDIWVFLSSS